MNLQEALYILARASNQYHLKKAQADEENALLARVFTRFVSGSFEGLSVSDKFRCSNGHYSKHDYRMQFQKDNEDDEGTNRMMDKVQTLNNYINVPSARTFRSYDEEDFDLIFKVDMKCREELAPIELIKEPLFNETEYGTEASVYTAHDFRPDLRLNLEIECPAAERDIRPPAVYRCLIQQIHTQQGAPVGIREYDRTISAICAA
jgi:hypothetical protein